MKATRRSHLKAEIVALKESEPCEDCHRYFPAYVMDYDHRDPTTKIATISKITKEAKTVAEVWDELDKCDLVCANCHRIRTHGNDEYDDRIREYQNPELYQQIRDWTG